MHEAEFLHESAPNGRSSYELDETPATWTSTPTPSHHVLISSTSSDGDRTPVKHQQVQQQVKEVNNTSIQDRQDRGLHWRAPVSMVGYLLLGIGFALGHHFYWSSLDDTVVPSDTDQEWSSRLGIAAAFLTQSALTLAVGAAYTQRIWVTVKRKPLTLSGLDKVFSLQSDIFSFLSKEILGRAKFLALIGICAWCIPISSTISSATLSVRSGMVTNVTELNVPVPDYTNNTWYNWAVYSGPGYLVNTSAAIIRTTTATSTLMYITPFSAPFPNSTYSLQIWGPAFRCQTLSEALLEDNLNLGDASSLQEAWDITMNGTLKGGASLYVAKSPEFVSNVNMKSHLFITTSWSPILEMPGQNYSCHLWNTSYALDFNFNNGDQNINIRELIYVTPLSIDTENNAKMVDKYSAGEVQYWSMFTALRSILATTINYSASLELNGGDSALLHSGIAACPEIINSSSSFGDTSLPSFYSDWMCRAGSVPGAIEDLSRNLTLSVLSSSLLSNETLANVTAYTAANFYTYNWRNLVMAYTIAVAAALLCVGIGIQSLLTNGYSAGSSFSSILLTTRNPDLDSLAQGHCLGAKPIPKDIGKTVLRFGVLDSQPYDKDVGGHAAFGLWDDVRMLEKGEKCW